MVHHDRGTKLDTVGWSLFFIWVGIAWIADFGTGIGLLGVAAITLTMQLVRKLQGLRVEVFWVVVGTAFGIGGLWEIFDVQTPLAPLVLIINPSKGLFNWIFGISFVGPSPRGEGARFYFDLALFRFALLLASRSR